jgi:hypothetical protein
MKAILQFAKVYRLSIIAYVVYLALFFNQISAQQSFRAAASHINNGDRVAWGEGIMYGELLVSLIGTGGVFVCLLIAVTYKDKRKHFLILGFLLLIPAGYFLTTVLN